jgi:transcriptional regulator NrdR family protein
MITGRMRRRFECRNCKLRWSTYEITDQEFKRMQAAVRRLKVIQDALTANIEEDVDNK